MKIIRFLDEHDRQCYGHGYSDSHAILLEGELFGELTDTGRRVRVKKNPGTVGAHSHLRHRP